MSFYVFSLIVFSVFSVTISLCYVSLALIIRIPGIAFKKCRIYFKIRRMNHCKFIKALSLFFSRCESKKKLYQNMILLAVFSLEHSFHFKRNMILINFVYLFKKNIFFVHLRNFLLCLLSVVVTIYSESDDQNTSIVDSHDIF